jgi:D-glycero-D-manno-heptose 1,7-bisphosphate phosphatase
MSAHGDAGKVVVLDRDGTIVVDRGYLDDPDGLEFLPGAALGLRALHARGCRLVVVTNQSGVGRGFYPMDRVLAMNERLRAMVRAIGAELAAIYVCPHAPEEHCACRKPAQALMLRAAADLSFEPRRAVMIGDKQSDVEFGRRAGALSVLIAEAAPSADWPHRPDLVVPDLNVAADALQARQI